MSIKISLALNLMSLLSVLFIASWQSNLSYLETAFLKSTTEQIEMIMVKDSHMHFIAVVLVVSAMVFLYSKMYFGNETETNKDYFFYFNLLMFSLSMLALILANNMILVMLGWDGLGVASFLLITYYSTSLASSSALATFSLNRVGDMFLMVTLIFMLNLSTVTPLESIGVGAQGVGNSAKVAMCASFTMGCMTKSAQMPFSSWLPAAMAAPTPVSALVHSSTLVTAGIYLMLKMQYISADVASIQWSVMLLAVSLSLLAGIFAILEKDIKKMVAMSTLSQLGILMFNLGLGSYLITLFHLLSHAFFKSVLFMMSGMLILASLATQDLRKVASMKFSSAVILTTIISSALNLSGFPYLSGFFSKDSIILEEYFLGVSELIKLAFLAACCVSVGYSAKIVWYFLCQLFSSTPSTSNSNKNLLTFPTLVLAMASTVMGKTYVVGYMHKEAYKMFCFEKALGMYIIATALAVMTFLPNYVFKKQIGVKIAMSQMLNMKFVGPTLMSQLGLKIDLIYMAEKMMWVKVVEYGTSAASNLTNIVRSIKSVLATFLAVLVIVAT